jgi:streptogramin lyase
VWVAHGLRGQVSRIDPQFGQVTRSIPVAGTAFGSPNGSVAIGAGSVWAVFGDSTLARIDVAGDLLERGLAGSQPAGIVVAAGSVWVTNSGDATVHRFSPETFRQDPLQTFNVSRRPTGITYADGAIWVANSGDDVVTRIDPGSGATLQVSVGEGPSALANDSDAVWVTNGTAGTRLAHRPEYERGRGDDRDRQRAIRHRCGGRLPVGHRAGAVARRAISRGRQPSDRGPGEERCSRRASRRASAR